MPPKQIVIVILMLVNPFWTFPNPGRAPDAAPRLWNQTISPPPRAKSKSRTTGGPACRTTAAATPPPSPKPPRFGFLPHSRFERTTLFWETIRGARTVWRWNSAGTTWILGTFAKTKNPDCRGGAAPRCKPANRSDPRLLPANCPTWNARNSYSKWGDAPRSRSNSDDSSRKSSSRSSRTDRPVWWKTNADDENNNNNNSDPQRDLRRDPPRLRAGTAATVVLRSPHRARDLLPPSTLPWRKQGRNFKNQTKPSMNLYSFANNF